MFIKKIKSNFFYVSPLTTLETKQTLIAYS